MTTNSEQVTITAEEFGAILASFVRGIQKTRTYTGSGDPDLGKIITKWREIAGKSIRGLAADTKLHDTMIGKLERGERGMTVSSLASLAKGLPEGFLDEFLTAAMAKSPGSVRDEE